MKFITLPNGKNLLMLNKYTFNKNAKMGKGGHRWACSSLAQGCKAFIHTSKDMEIIRFDSKHDHLPPNYIRTKSGIYVKC